MTVEFKDGFWCFQVILGDEDNPEYETFETDDLEEAIDEAARIIEELRAEEDPLAELFDED